MKLSKTISNHAKHYEDFHFSGINFYYLYTNTDENYVFVSKESTFSIPVFCYFNSKDDTFIFVIYHPFDDLSIVLTRSNLKVYTALHTIYDLVFSYFKNFKR